MSMYIYNYIYMSMYIYIYIICGLHYIYRSMDHMWSMQQDDLLQQHGAALRYIYPSYFEGFLRSKKQMFHGHSKKLMACV